MSESPGPAVASSPTTHRSKRAARVGEVLTAARDKTIKVTVSYQVRHPKYGKYMRRRTVLHAHDEKNEAGVGDLVELAECRPLSKTKHWRLVRVVRKSLTSR
ncbi:MAG: 30S ribosomal protein S17 [Planctomycetes bacterium]|nr:30S ribosomal protein S17 [Planctomycetota bacterium]